MNALQSPTFIGFGVEQIEAIVQRLPPARRALFRWVRPALEQAVEPLFGRGAVSRAALRSAASKVAEVVVRLGPELVAAVVALDVNWQSEMALPAGAKARAESHLKSPAAYFDFVWTCAAIGEFMQSVVPAAREAMEDESESLGTPPAFDAVNLEVLADDPLLQVYALLTAVSMAVNARRAPRRAALLAHMAFDRMQAFLASQPAAGMNIAPHLHGTRAENAEWHRLALAATGPIPAEVLESGGA